MASGHERRDRGWWRPATLRRIARSTRRWVNRRIARVFSRSPRPVQQAWRLADRTVRESLGDRVPGMAAEVALYTLISLPALLLVILGSLGFIADALGSQGTDELNRLVFEFPEAALSSRTYESYEQVARNVMEQGRGDVISIGVVVSLWTGSRAINRYLETITIAYDLDDPRPIWRRRALAYALTVAALVAGVAILPPLVLGSRLVRWIAPDSVADVSLTILDALFWPGMVLLVLITLASLYHIGVPWRTPWRRDLPGAVLAMFVWLLASAALRAYLAVSVGEEAVYSQLATPIAVVLWLYVTALAVLLGAELNAEIEKMWPYKQHPWRLRRRRIHDARTQCHQ